MAGVCGGWLLETFGDEGFFLYCTVVAVSGFFLCTFNVEGSFV